MMIIIMTMIQTMIPIIYKFVIIFYDKIKIEIIKYYNIIILQYYISIIHYTSYLTYKCLTRQNYIK